MKHLFSLLLTVFLVFSGLSTVHAKCSIWLKNSVATVNNNQSIIGTYIPTVAIGHSSDHNVEVNFAISLDGAKWDYEKSGTLYPGVTYKLEDSDTMKITVENGVGNNKFDFYSKNLYIPLYSTPTKGGKIKFIVESRNSSVSDSTIVYAININGDIKASTKKIEINQIGELNTIQITDNSTCSISKNSYFILELDTSFKFTNEVTPEATGKFQDKCSFTIDSNNKSKAYIRFSEDIPEEKGTISLNGLVIQRKSDVSFNVAMMKVSAVNTTIPLESNVVIAKYNKDAEYSGTEATKETTTEITTEVTTETLTEASTNIQPTTVSEENIVIVIGADTYSVGNKNYSLDVSAYINKDGYTMMPLRAMANSIGINDENINYDNESKTATLTHGSITAEITADVNKINVNGFDVTIDCSAEIKDGRLFLPLRAMSNIFGIDNSNIEFESETKTITIKK